MIVPLRGWSWRVGGGGVTLCLDEAPALARIRYRERLRPVRSARALAAIAAGRLEGGVAGPVRPFVSAEGEYGALVSVDGALGARQARRTLGLIFAEDFYACVDGLALSPRLTPVVEAAVEELARGDRLMLGIRRRRFVYQPPPRWQAHSPLALHTHWFPADQRRQPCMLVVYPALPRNGGAASTPEDELAVLRTGPTTGLIVDGAALGPTPVAAGPLRGHAWELDCRDRAGRKWARRVTIAGDERYAYPVFFDRRREQRGQGLDVLDAMLASIQPIPAGGGGSTRDPEATVLDYWV